MDGDATTAVLLFPNGIFNICLCENPFNQSISTDIAQISVRLSWLTERNDMSSPYLSKGPYS